ncbi:hypothetical protein Hokovirus_2_169 [Hokovirus HKV1]|uniref:Uncharacterized protein n=1 Tax=Hokovirus HKV1 TaxID=1977638 RepID=A0A1V0SFZ8_9VIRU|nr:hypothetical protein Hokovirus_2_169 [Hokovirus HKV1]
MLDNIINNLRSQVKYNISLDSSILQLCNDHLLKFCIYEERNNLICEDDIFMIDFVDNNYVINDFQKYFEPIIVNDEEELLNKLTSCINNIHSNIKILHTCK